MSSRSPCTLLPLGSIHLLKVSLCIRSCQGSPQRPWDIFWLCLCMPLLPLVCFTSSSQQVLLRTPSDYWKWEPEASENSCAPLWSPWAMTDKRPTSFAQTSLFVPRAPQRCSLNGSFSLILNMWAHKSQLEKRETAGLHGTRPSFWEAYLQ